MKSKSWVTDEMRKLIGVEMRKSISHPVAASDIRKWAIAVFYPVSPPRLFWDEHFAKKTKYGGLVAPEEFNPFAWSSAQPSLTDPKVSQTAFSERELDVEPPNYRAILLTEIREQYGEQRIRPGDTITSVVHIKDYFEREGRMGHMLYTTLANVWSNQSNEWLRTTESVFVRY